jgi:hypothetical protein
MDHHPLHGTICHTYPTIVGPTKSRRATDYVDMQVGGFVDTSAVKIQRACTAKTTADPPRPLHVGIGLGDRVPALAYTLDLTASPEDLDPVRPVALSD